MRRPRRRLPPAAFKRNHRGNLIYDTATRDSAGHLTRAAEPDVGSFTSRVSFGFRAPFFAFGMHPTSLCTIIHSGLPSIVRRDACFHLD